MYVNGGLCTVSCLDANGDACQLTVVQAELLERGKLQGDILCRDATYHKNKYRQISGTWPSNDRSRECSSKLMRKW